MRLCPHEDLSCWKCARIVMDEREHPHKVTCHRTYAQKIVWFEKLYTGYICLFCRCGESTYVRDRNNWAAFCAEWNRWIEMHKQSYDRWDQMERTEQCSGMRNKRDVWTVATKPYKEAHFATFPPKLIEPCVLAGCPENGYVLDPFCGSGTTGEVSLKQGRNFIGIELNPSYVKLAHNRIGKVCGLFSEAV